MICSYCNNPNSKLTREHIIPDCYLKAMNRNAMITWFNAVPKRVIKGDMVIKDVCEKCNGEHLSKLDNYSFHLIKSYNGKINYSTRKLFFKYNFNLLSRWLLKVSYNSARANKANFDSELYKKIAYFITKNEPAPLKFSIFVQFMDLSTENKTKHSYYHFEPDSNYTIDFFRIAPIRFTTIQTHGCAIRSILINSFAFFIIVYDENCSEDEYLQIEAQLLNENPNAIKLSPKSKKVKLIKDKNFWKTSHIGNIELRKNFLKEREIDYNEKLLIITLKKEEIINKDFAQINHFIASKTYSRDDVMDYFQRFEICVDGYNNDSRELYDIPEFRLYACTLIEDFPEIFWFLNLNMGFTLVLIASYLKTFENIVENPLTDLLQNCFGNINEMTNFFAIDNSYNSKITELLSKKLKEMLVN